MVPENRKEEGVILDMTVVWRNITITNLKNVSHWIHKSKEESDFCQQLLKTSSKTATLQMLLLIV